MKLRRVKIKKLVAPTQKPTEHKYRHFSKPVEINRTNCNNNDDDLYSARIHLGKVLVALSPIIRARFWQQFMQHLSIIIILYTTGAVHISESMTGCTLVSQ